MKFKDFEGEAQEIKEILQDFNVDVPAYLGVAATSRKIPMIWIIVLTFLFFLLACLKWIGIFPSEWAKVSVLGLILLSGFIVLFVHLNFRNWSITAIAGISCLIIALLALNVYTPQEIMIKIEKHTEQKL